MPNANQVKVVISKPQQWYCTSKNIHETISQSLYFLWSKNCQVQTSNFLNPESKPKSESETWLSCCYWDSASSNDDHLLLAFISVAQMSWWRNDILYANPWLCFWSCPNSAWSFFDLNLLECKKKNKSTHWRSNRTSDQISSTSAIDFKHVVNRDLRLLPCLIHHEVNN